VKVGGEQADKRTTAAEEPVTDPVVEDPPVERGTDQVPAAADPQVSEEGGPKSSAEIAQLFKERFDGEIIVEKSEGKE
jgi:hypothetical protein